MGFWAAALPVISSFAGGLGQGSSSGQGALPSGFAGTNTAGGSIVITRDSPGTGVNAVGSPLGGQVPLSGPGMTDQNKIILYAAMIGIGFAIAKMR